MEIPMTDWNYVYEYLHKQYQVRSANVTIGEAGTVELEMDYEGYIRLIGDLMCANSIEEDAESQSQSEPDEDGYTFDELMKFKS